MTTVEKMARAVREADAEATLRRLPNTNLAILELALDAMKSSHEAMALAALKALLEPSEGMVRAAFDEGLVPAFDFKAGWTAAINHAIQEHEG